MTPVTAVLLALGSLGVLLLDARGQTPATYPATAVAAKKKKHKHKKKCKARKAKQAKKHKRAKRHCKKRAAA